MRGRAMYVHACTYVCVKERKRKRERERERERVQGKSESESEGGRDRWRLRGRAMYVHGHVYVRVRVRVRETERERERERECGGRSAHARRLANDGVHDDALDAARATVHPGAHGVACLQRVHEATLHQ